MSDDRRQDVRTVSRIERHRGAILTLVETRIELPSGRAQDLTIVEHPGAVAIAALLDDGRMLLVEQYRHAVGETLLEIPAGRIETGEQPIDAARRELEEETGHRAARWEHLLDFYPAPGFCSERMNLFLATEVHAVSARAHEPDPDEELVVVRLAPAQVLRRGCRDAKTLIAAAWLGANLADARSAGN